MSPALLNKPLLCHCAPTPFFIPVHSKHFLAFFFWFVLFDSVFFVRGRQYTESFTYFGDALFDFA